jgi:hypothetical protein
LVNKRTLKELTLQVKDQAIKTKGHVKYLGVWLSANMNMRFHIEYAAAKGNSCAMALAKLMPCQGGPQHRARKVLARAGLSAITYAAPVWIDATSSKTNRDLLRRKAKPLYLRVCFGNRRIAAVAAEVIAGIPPVHLAAKAQVTGPEHILRAWQQEWESESPGVAAWTKRLITDLKPWFERKHGWTTYHLTQLLSGHGAARAGLYKCGLVKTPLCVFCGKEDTTEHAFFTCAMFAREKQALDRKLGHVTPDNVVGKMLENQKAWDLVQEYTKAIVTCKELWSDTVD